MSSEYQLEILYRPANALARFQLRPGQKLVGRAGSMMAMSGDIQVAAGLHGGAMGTLKRLLTGGTAAVALFTCGEQPGELILSPKQPGDILVLDLQEQSYAVQFGSILAVSPGFNFSPLFSGVKGVVGTRRQMMTRIEGSGLVLLSCCGWQHKMSLEEGKSYLLDAGHVLAYPSTIASRFVPLSEDGVVTSALAGNAMVLEMTGPGEVVMQTRTAHGEVATLDNLAKGVK